FAEATDDQQWIHVDPIKAASDSPYKTTIAHGFLTLSLASALLRRAMSFPGIRMAINYGCNRVRFVSAVPSGARVRRRFKVVVLEEVAGALRVLWTVTIEGEDHERPAAVLEWLVRYYR